MGGLEMKTKIAIACQGGGAETAFTAGALQALFEAGIDKEFEVVSLGSKPRRSGHPFRHFLESAPDRDLLNIVSDLDRSSWALRHQSDLV
jgi:hypothetical protein